MMVIYNDVDQYHLLNPSKYRHVFDFRLTRDTGDIARVNIELEMRSRDGCCDTRIGNITSLARIWIEVEQVRSPFFEHVRFKVFDVEEGVIEFLCEDFAVETMCANGA